MLTKISDNPTKEEILEFAKQEKVEFVNIQFTDLFGAIKAITVPIDKLESVIDNNVWFDGSSILGFTRIFESDMFLKPDLKTFAVLPWTRERKSVVARIIGDVYMPDETPFEGDPRYILKRMLGKCDEMGFKFFAGPELEFFMFKRDENGKLHPLPHDKAGYFDQTTDIASDIRHTMSHNMREMGLEVEALHHEVAEGQHEIGIKYAEALTMADMAMTLKWVVKETAARFGLHATFMPKPVYGINGSGMHVHQSLFKDGVNAFYDAKDTEYGLSTLARQFMAGQLKHVREMNAVINPSVNSYKRLVPGYEAPVYIAWASKNRSALIRIPRFTKGNVNATRCELRCPDPSANPYLAFAAMLGAGLKGVSESYVLAEAVEENIYHFTEDDLDKKGIGKLVGSLGEAILEFKKSSLMREVFGEHTFREYVNAKTAEWDDYRLMVSPWERERYMEVY
jgi:glutamine synthetase